jgi:branched-chain amino acid transport system permease protein
MMRRGTSSTLAAIALALVFAAIAWFGASANNYLLQAGTTLAMSIVLCLAWNIVGGFMGYPSFATAALFGLGAYIGAITQNADVPMAIAWALAGLGGGVFALGLGSILLRLRGHYFAIGTIAVVEVMREIANNWDTVTGGAVGLNVPIMIGSPRAVGIFFYGAMWTLALFAFLLSAAIAKSKFGFGLRCIRQNENAARMVGVDVVKYKVAAFVISGIVMALAGAVYASMVAFIEAKDVFNILMSIEVPVMVMLGAAGTLLGPIIGACLYVLLKELVWINFINFHSAILGVIIIAIVYAVPRGILGNFHRRFWMRLRPAAVRKA